jgi:hypothetical protein
MNATKLNRKARTVKEISGRCIATIPVGTEFTILYRGENPAYSTCTGLRVSSVWNDEYEFIDDAQPVLREEFVR